MRKLAIFGSASLVVGCVATTVFSQFGGGFGQSAPPAGLNRPFGQPLNNQPLNNQFAPPGFDAFTPQPQFAPAVPAQPGSRVTVSPMPPLRPVAYAAPPKQTRIWASPDAAANDPIRKKLASPLTDAGIDFAETPLEEVVEFLRDEYEIPIQIDVAALDDLGLQPDEPIDSSYAGITLGAALKLMLGQLELACVPKDGYLLFTTEEEASAMLKVALYPVADLGASVLQAKEPQVTRQVSGGGGGGGGGGFGFGGGFGGGGGGSVNVTSSLAVYSPLVDVIVMCVATETWAENGGGEAELQLLPNGLLVVSQTEAVHDQIAALLEAMRKASKPSAGRGIIAPVPPPQGVLPGQRLSPSAPPQPLRRPRRQPQEQFDFGFGDEPQPAPAKPAPAPRADSADPFGGS